MIFDKDQIVAILTAHRDATGIPFAFRAFQEPPTTDQYIAWLEMGSGSVAADDSAYFTATEFAVEYYSKQVRDFAGEAALEARFNEAGAFWRRTPSYLDDQEVYLTIYYL